jgi:hypothetical protein
VRAAKVAITKQYADCSEPKEDVAMQLGGCEAAKRAITKQQLEHREREKDGNWFIFISTLYERSSLW